MGRSGVIQFRRGPLVADGDCAQLSRGILPASDVMLLLAI